MHRLPAPSLLPTGVEDADELLAALVEGEEANFSLFNYVNDLSAEVDKLEDSIGSLRWVVAGRRHLLSADGLFYVCCQPGLPTMRL